MNKSLRVALIVTGIVVASALVLTVGVFAVKAAGGSTGFGPWGMMGWVGNGGSGSPMMGGAGMMGRCGRAGASTSGKPLSIDQARQAAEGYLAQVNNPDLEIKEIMIFSNNAYVRVTEKSTGTGAMELLVDPASLAVSPEYGPNMMWNLKYGHMAGAGGMMGGNGMMGGYQSGSPSTSSTMPVTPEQAVKIAQQYLDREYPGYQADPEPDAFYGYYTLDILKDGQPTGMLSVNGFSQQVFFHSWHGTFIEKSE